MLSLINLLTSSWLVVPVIVIAGSSRTTGVAECAVVVVILPCASTRGVCPAVNFVACFFQACTADTCNIHRTAAVMVAPERVACLLRGANVRITIFGKLCEECDAFRGHLFCRATIVRRASCLKGHI